MKIFPVICALCVICAACGLAACSGPAQPIGTAARLRRGGRGPRLLCRHAHVRSRKARKLPPLRAAVSGRCNGCSTRCRV